MYIFTKQLYFDLFICLFTKGCYIVFKCLLGNAQKFLRILEAEKWQFFGQIWSNFAFRKAKYILKIDKIFLAKLPSN